MNKTVIILAAGECRRFEGTIKQLLPICDGENFLTRMIRQCQERNCFDIYVATHNEEIIIAVQNIGVKTFVPENRSFTCETILSTKELWNDKTIVLLGDVYYTKNYMDIIFRYGENNQPDIKFFASPFEVHAFRFDNYYHQIIEKHLIDILSVAKAQSHGKVRRLMEKFDKSHLVPNRDHSRDIDLANQYEIFKREIVQERKHKLDDRKSS